MTDWKARCTELTEALCGYTLSQDDCLLVARTRAELAQPEPQGPGPVDYRRWHEAHSEDCNTWSEQPTAPLTLRTTVEALAWANYCLARWGRPAIEPVPQQEDVHYAWELHDAEGEWQAGGSANSLDDVQREGNRYLQTYSQDGPHKLIIERHCVTTIEPVPPEPGMADHVTDDEGTR